VEHISDILSIKKSTFICIDGLDEGMYGDAQQCKICRKKGEKEYNNEKNRIIDVKHRTKKDG